MLEIATAPSPLVVENAADNDDDAVGLAAKMIKHRIDDLPSDGMAYVRQLGHDTAIKAATVERMARCAANLTSLKHLFQDTL